MRLILTLLLAAISTGCLRSTTTIDLRPDGSGTIVQETGVSAQGLAMMRGFGGGNQPGGTPDLFSEEQARKAADTMGVTFVSGEPIKTADTEGYRARFSFDDISKIKVTMDQGGTLGPGTGPNGDTKQPPFSFGFDKSGATSVLTIDMPAQLPSGGPLGGLTGGGAGASDADKAQAAQVLSMMKMMMKGLFVNVSMNVNGRIVKSNAPVEGSRVTLLQIDFDKLVADEAGLQKLQAATALKDYSNIPGLKVVTDPKVTIEIAR